MKTMNKVYCLELYYLEINAVHKATMFFIYYHRSFYLDETSEGFLHEHIYVEIYFKADP